jgi:hypothetical protein
MGFDMPNSEEVQRAMVFQYRVKKFRADALNPTPKKLTLRLEYAIFFQIFVFFSPDFDMLLPLEIRILTILIPMLLSLIYVRFNWKVKKGNFTRNVVLLEREVLISLYFVNLMWAGSIMFFAKLAQTNSVLPHLCWQFFYSFATVVFFLYFLKSAKKSFVRRYTISESIINMKPRYMAIGGAGGIIGYHIAQRLLALNPSMLLLLFILIVAEFIICLVLSHEWYDFCQYEGILELEARLFSSEDERDNCS